jgi:hypothetical protein
LSAAAASVLACARDENRTTRSMHALNDGMRARATGSGCGIGSCSAPSESVPAAAEVGGVGLEPSAFMRAPLSSIEKLRWIVRQIEDPAKMTHTRMTLVRRGLAFLTLGQSKREKAKLTCYMQAIMIVTMRVYVVRAAQWTHADECCGRAGVQRGMCCVLEARMVQIACMSTVAGRPHQRREQIWMVAAGHGAPCGTWDHA